MNQESKNNLYKILKKKNIIFVGIGSPNICMDAFGPRLAEELQKLGYKTYGSTTDPITKINLKEKLKEIKRRHFSDYIVAIDATIVDSKFSEKQLGEIIVERNGLRPASFSDKTAKMFGNGCIKMVCCKADTYITNDIFETKMKEIIEDINIFHEKCKK